MSSHDEYTLEVIASCLKRGRRVEIDGLGTFLPRAGGKVELVASARRKVFIAYVQEDLPSAERLYESLARHGLDPWLDRRKLLPGQNWPRAIEQAIEVSDFFIACLSSRAVRKRGQFQAELRYALEIARRQPLDSIFLIPVRLEECRVPARISREYQYVDLFPDWSRGVRRVLRAIRSATKANLPRLGVVSSSRRKTPSAR